MKSHYFLLIILFLSSACTKQDLSQKPAILNEVELFPTSPFYSPIQAVPEIDPNSNLMVQSLMDQAEQGFLVAVKEWTVAVYYADANTLRQEVKLTASWAPKKSLMNVPIPDFAEPDPEGDGSMVIIDEVNGCVYDFWVFRYAGGSYKASWGNALPIQSDGIFPKGMSARGSGFSLLQGVIWPSEVSAGEINHALVFSFNHTRSGGPVPPATESDGTTHGNQAIPEGALVQLDPELDLRSLGLNSYEMTIAEALQKYGMYCCDDGGGLQLYAVNPISVSSNPYESIWGDQTYIDLSKIPVDRFRVLKLGEQIADPDLEIVPNSCAEFE